MYTGITTPPRPLAHQSTPKSGGFTTTTPYNWRINPPSQRYDKPALDENELIGRYIERGLIITDRNRTARYLRHIGYYRLSPYTIPFQAESWLIIELLTSGELQRLYAGLARKYRKAIARELHLTEPVLQSWLKSHVRVRNICAHHGRLWNRFLGVYPAIPKSGTVRWLNDGSTFDTGNPGALERKRLYPVLVSLQSILFTISPHSTWALRLHTLFENYHNIPLNALGMKANWDADKFWQEAFEAGS